MVTYTNHNLLQAMRGGLKSHKSIPAERFFQKLPELAIAGDEQSVDRIAYELLNLLMESTEADVGQISLLPRGGRVEKVCIIKDGQPWLSSDMALHLYNPGKGFTAQVVRTGRTLAVDDIWEEGAGSQPNPFLQIAAFMDKHYLDEIKRPVSALLILPVKRNQEVFCTIELSRYRGEPPFDLDNRVMLEEFAAQYGAVLINYLLDTKNRIALNTAYARLNNISRLVASSARVDYTDAVAAYRTLSAADLGFAFFRRGEGYECHALTIVAWQREKIREICIPEFKPSVDSVLCNSSEVSYPVEGDHRSRRLGRFKKRITNTEDIKNEDREFLLGVIDKIRSYVVYPLHMLNQDLGVIHLASSRNDFCAYLHMSPFLSLYNALLKSFLLNERVADLLSQTSLKIHNPGFYCLGGLKTALLQESPDLLRNPKINSALNCLDDLMTDIHDQGKILTCRNRDINFERWLRAWVNQKRSYHASLLFDFDMTREMEGNGYVRANYEQLETVFENLLANSLRAIAMGQRGDSRLVGRITLQLMQLPEKLSVRFQDNGRPYKTVSGRGTPQMQSIMQQLGGSFKRDMHPYCVYLEFPYKIKEGKEVHHEH